MKILSLASALMATALSHGAVATAYENSWDHGWAAVAADGQCHLQLGLTGYGTARFVASAGSELGFELQAMRDFQGSPMQVVRITPDWLPQPAQETGLGQLVHIPGGGSLDAGGLTQRMFLALRQGYDLELRGTTTVRGPLRLRMRALQFFESMQEFLSCAHTQITVAWESVSRTRVMFEVNEHKVSDNSELDGLVRYLSVFPDITRVYIDGHTDASGGERANHQLAKRRAMAVSAYLQRAGVPERLIVTRYHGERYPVATNDTLAGRAENRRVTIRLERAPSTEIAAQ